MNAREIRKKFLDFFESKGHQIVPSAPLVIKDDPTLMFTNAGMNQFKDYFLGNKEAKYKRVADTQKCLRVSGKHNDLEEVGIDTYHHTLFEMLGNWSFGDYFKEEAIELAWELLTKVYKLPEDRLYVSVFGGDKKDGMEADEEAKALWKTHIPEDRIIYGSKKDNFWEMGDTGPCGPCSEIHIDLRPDEERKEVDGKDLVNQDHQLVVEIWNLVFIQFNRKADGSLESLPAKHVDTGMGFERLVMAIMGKKSNYDTDVFTPLIQELEKLSGVNYGENEKSDIAFRVISDHVRAVAFAITDGQLPGNTGAGYVIRRILRRAVRYGFTYLNFEEAFIFKLVDILGDQFGEVFPEIVEQKDFVSKVIHEEEQSFLRTLENGIKVFDEALADSTKKGLKNEDGKILIPGETAFKLIDTFGFPIDLTILMARENDAVVDIDAFETAMQQQKDRSKAAAAQQKGDWIEVQAGSEIQFLGYDTLQSETKLLRYRQIKDKKGTNFQLVLEQTPFYAESGGQVGDTGILDFEGEKIDVYDTQKENELVIHFVNKLPSKLEAKVLAEVNKEKRTLTESNHSCTHLLHAALRQVLGDHVQQKGSYVSDKVLRFDFSHFAKMTDEEIYQVEKIVDQKIREDIPLLEDRQVPYAEALKRGATALFGEKYGEKVRVITFDQDYSVELCGGTHVSATGKIGWFKVISESSVAAGVRRIEALTSEGAEAYIDTRLQLLDQINEVLKNPKDTLKAVETLLKERTELNKRVEKFQQEQSKNIKGDLISRSDKVGDTTVIIDKIQLPSADNLKKLAFELKNEINSLVAILAADIEGKPQIAVVFSDDLVKEKGLNAGQTIRELAKEIKGGGGGQPFFATAGGKDINGLDNVITRSKELISDFDLA